MIRSKCLKCGGGGSGNWYECICDAPAPSADSLAAVSDATRGIAIRQAIRKRLRTGTFKYDYLANEEYALQNFDASIVVVCDAIDIDQCETLSRWLYYKRLLSTPDGFCIMPVDADNAFHIRAVSVKNLGNEGNEELWDVFNSLPWQNHNAARLTVQMNGATYI